ncbi:c-type cytochrome [Marinicellulosiphila megalodicopiae]|uniref:c-type cytochrome n=1 Tax=Marinicellulosiphila megalodicopiae TaxID=2724896 RepID=UPI003BAF834B
MKKIIICSISTAVLVLSCSKQDNIESIPVTNEPFTTPTFDMVKQDTRRWYSNQMVKNGEQTFQDYCGACHKKDASGAKNWMDKPKKGSYHTPPLNGDAHAWHHPLIALHQTIKGGTVKYGGNMPAWESILNDEQIYEAISFFQSKWNDDTYAAWLKRNRPQP